MENTQLEWWILIFPYLVPGLIIVLSYGIRWRAIRAAGFRMLHAEASSNSRLLDTRGFWTWAFVAVCTGLIPNIGAIILAILIGSNSFDAGVVGINRFEWSGLALFYIGAIAWPWTLSSREGEEAVKHREFLALAMTSLGLVIWASSGESWWSVFVGVAAAYSIVVDMCWYGYRIETSFGGVKDDRQKLLDSDKQQQNMRELACRYGVWQGLLAMIHFAFAFYIAAETTRAPDSFMPPISLWYNKWIKSDPNADSCDDTVCLIAPVSTSYGQIDIGYVAASFSWISGTQHLVSYVGILSDNDWIQKQVGFKGGDVSQGNVLRAIDYAFSASLMLCCIVILFETPGSITTLCGYFSAMALVVLAGYSSETLLGLTDQRASAIGLTVWASGCYLLLWLPLLTILWNIFHTGITRTLWNPKSNSEDDDLGIQFDFDTPSEAPPLTVLFVIWWLFFSFLVFPIVHAIRLSLPPTRENAIRTEVLYSMASFLSKLPLLAVIAGGLVARRRTFTGPELAANPDPAESSPAVFVAIGVGTGISVLLAVGMMVSFRGTLRGLCGSSPNADMVF